MSDFYTISNALYCVDAHPYETWISMGMAIKSELLEAGWPLWNAWSATAVNYDEKEAIRQWKNFKAEGGTKIGTLFREARNQGWKSDAPYTPQPKPKFDTAVWLSKKGQEKADKLLAEKDQAEAAQRAREWWGRTSGPAIANHPYCKRKHIKPKGARHAGGILFIPMYDQDHSLVNLQRIYENGSKWFLKNGKLKGCYGLVCNNHDPDLPPIRSLGGGEVMLCEGWATACTLYTKHRLPVFVAFSAGNLAAVAKLMDDVLSAKFTKVWVCGDVDKGGAGQKAAAAAMANIRFREKALMLPVFTNEQKTAFAERHEGNIPSDYNDLDCIERGLA